MNQLRYLTYFCRALKNHTQVMMMRMIKRSLVFTIVVTLCLSACKKDAPSLPESLSPVVQAYEQDKSSENKRNLAQAIRKELGAQDVPDQMLLSSAVDYAREMDDQRLLATCLTDQLKHYYDSPESAARMEQLIDIYDKKIRKPDAAVVLRLGYINTFPESSKVAEYKAAIPDVAPSVDTFLYRIASNIIDENNSFDLSRARNYVEVSELGVLAEPQRTSAPQLLFNAAKTANTIKSYDKALEFYDWILRKYPESDLIGKSLFMKAFTYDTNLKDLGNAKKTYEAFLAKYPKDDLADDAQFLLDNLGVSEEELLRRIQSGQNKE